jgi:outer membrane receptor protein involved in Fe transport
MREQVAWSPADSAPEPAEVLRLQGVPPQAGLAPRVGALVEAAAPGTADLASGLGALSRWRHYATFDWSRGAWGATLAQNFQLGHKEYDLTTRNPATGEFSGLRRVGSYSTWDLQGRYTGLKNLTASAGIRNLFDRDPPQAYGPGTFQRGYDASYADARGRMFYLSLRYAIR